MNQSASPGSPEQGKRNEPSPERRRVLKAAAAAAPLVATLPCGTARATSSTYQCAIVDRYNTQSPGFPTAVENGALPVPPSASTYSTAWDGYVRTQGYEYVFSKDGDPDSPLTLYTIGNTADDDGLGTFYKANGDTFVDPSAPGNDWSLDSATPVGLLVMYVADSATDPTCVETCPGPSCIYPRAQVGDGGGSGNFGLTGSCLASVDPETSGTCSI